MVAHDSTSPIRFQDGFRRCEGGAAGGPRPRNVSTCPDLSGPVNHRSVHTDRASLQQPAGHSIHSRHKYTWIYERLGEILIWPCQQPPGWMSLAPQSTGSASLRAQDEAVDFSSAGHGYLLRSHVLLSYLIKALLSRGGASHPHTALELQRRPLQKECKQPRATSAPITPTDSSCEQGLWLAGSYQMNRTCGARKEANAT
ncbi:hypothetical protein EYF80_013427 [Liparis tanakae]|uniref:Uncharacterized protein n=1 Tax=Liparis tanakae TaxID=230148 RepID=A0A4Z2IEB4_9TELE|nr:hypothetical protein EYF80_013427 [Liparis tanakae]